MRNRQLIARWAYEHGKADNVVEFAKRDGKLTLSSMIMKTTEFVR